MTYRLSVSNIAWPSEARESIYALLKDLGVTGIEVALTKIAAWDRLTDDVLARERYVLDSFGLTVSSYQALYFGRPELQLLGTDEEFGLLLQHTVRVAQAAQRLSDGGVGVFGAPRNRRRGVMSEADAFSLGQQRFGALAEAVAPFGFSLALEPAPTPYGGDFLETSAVCTAMVRAVAHPAFRLQIDTGCLALTGEDAASVVMGNADIIGHVHLSRPHLSPIETGAGLHSVLLGLARADYSGWVAIEMRETADPTDAVERAIAAVLSAREKG